MPDINFKASSDLTSSELFEIYRKYVKHQYDLINHRTAWLGTLQSFLFATFGFTLQKKVEVVEKLYAVDGKNCSTFQIACENIGYLDFIMAILCIAGIGSALVAIVALKAASAPISLLFDKWEWHRHSITGSAANFMPLLTGGTEKRFATLGRTATFFLPLILVSCWAMIWLFVIICPFFRCTSFLPYAFPYLFPVCSGTF